MKITAVVSTKGGVGKTTVEANLGALCANAGLRTPHPISDLWYIEREIDTPEQLRLHIAQLAREIASSVNAPGEIVDVEGGVGFS